MLYHLIPKTKMNAMRKHYIEGKLRTCMAKELKLSTATIHRYRLHFDRIKREYPDRLTDMDFYIPDEPKPHLPTPLYNGLIEVLPGLVAAEQHGFQIKTLWQKYKQLKPNGYKYCTFKEQFYFWVADHPLKNGNWLPPLNKADMEVLAKWRKCNDHRKWQIAKTLVMASTTDESFRCIAKKVDASRGTVS